MRDSTPPISSSSPPPDLSRQVEVFDPRWHDTGRSGYRSYCVLLQCRGEDGDGDGGDAVPSQRLRSAVRRRPADFYWLALQVGWEIPGSIVPPLLPGLDSFSPPSLSPRNVHGETAEDAASRTEFNLWINRIVRHPELGDAPSLWTFLRANDGALDEAKAASDVRVSDRGEQPIIFRARRLAGRARARAATVILWSENELLIEEAEAYVAGLEGTVLALSKCARRLGEIRTVRDSSIRSMADGFSDIFTGDFPGVGLSRQLYLAKFMAKVKKVMYRLSTMEAEQGYKGNTEFEGAVQDLEREVHSVRMAIERRHDVQLNHTHNARKVLNLKHERGYLRDHEVDDYMKEQIDVMMEEIKSAEDAAIKSKKEFVQASERLFREEERYLPKIEASIREVLSTWASAQISHNTMARFFWGQLLPCLELADE